MGFLRSYQPARLSGIGSRTANVTAASSACPWVMPIFTIVGADTTVENGTSKGMRTGTPGIVRGRIPEMIIDPDAPSTWPSGSVIENDTA